MQASLDHRPLSERYFSDPHWSWASTIFSASPPLLPSLCPSFSLALLSSLAWAVTRLRGRTFGEKRVCAACKMVTCTTLLVSLLLMVLFTAPLCSAQSCGTSDSAWGVADPRLIGCVNFQGSLSVHQQTLLPPPAWSPLVAHHRQRSCRITRCLQRLIAPVDA